MHTQLKIKCRKCGLHFIIATWHPENHTRKDIICPECGQKEGLYAIFSEEVALNICEVVPGTAKLKEL